MRHAFLALTAVFALAACSSKEEKTPVPAEGAVPETSPSRTAPAPPATPGSPRRIELTVTEKGYEPTPVKVVKDQPLELVITRKTDKTCAKDIVVLGYDIKKELPLGQPVVVAFTPTKAGELRYGCSMEQMVSGVLMVE